MDDLISRHAAIEHLKKRLIETAINNVGLRAPCDSIFADIADNKIETWIMEIPSAVDAVEVRYGKWQIEFGKSFVSCSECGFCIVRIAEFNYCPNCGAKMEVDYGQADH